MTTAPGNVNDPNANTLVAKRLDAIRHTVNSMASSRKVTDTFLFIFLFFKWLSSTLGIFPPCPHYGGGRSVRTIAAGFRFAVLRAAADAAGGRGPNEVWEGLVRRNEVSFRPPGFLNIINNLRRRVIVATMEVRFAHPSQAEAWAPPAHEVAGDHASTVATITRLIEGNYSPASLRRSAFSAIWS